MRTHSVVVALVIAALPACGDGETSASSGIDPCYRYQARVYKRAAETLQASIQRHVPVMIRTTADMLAAAETRSSSQLRAAHDTFTRTSDDFLADGGDFATLMDEADAACD